jgi:hypothetical protein
MAFMLFRRFWPCKVGSGRKVRVARFLSNWFADPRLAVDGSAGFKGKGGDKRRRWRCGRFEGKSGER